jgi:HEAT repeat protein
VRRRRAPRAALCLGLALAGCERRPAEEPPPPLPSPRLEPRQAHFERLAAGAPPAPAEADLAEARQLLEPAFVSELGDARLAAKSRAALRADPHAGAVLEGALAHASPEVRAGAAAELGALDRPAALVPLVLRLKYEQDPVVLVHVADGLARRGCGAGLDRLLAALRDAATADLAGQRAIDLLRQHGDDPGETPTWEAIARGLRALQDRWRGTGRLRDGAPGLDDALRARLAGLVAALQGFQLRPVDDARFVLARVGELALSLLREAVSAVEPYLRTHALEVLRDLGPAASTLAADVLPLLADPLSRTDAARALGALRAKDAVPHLVAWLRSADVELRAAAAGALGPLGDRATLPLLRARMDDAGESLDVRVMAAFSVALFELDRPAYRFLVDLREKKGYHEATLSELIDRIDGWR